MLRNRTQLAATATKGLARTLIALGQTISATFGQTLNVRASLVEWENRLKVSYLITDLASGERLTRASTVQVAVEIASREMQLASPKVFTEAVERMLR